MYNSNTFDMCYRYSMCICGFSLLLNSLGLPAQTKPRFVMSGTLIFPHNLQNMIYFVTKFGMRKLCVVP